MLLLVVSHHFSRYVDEQLAFCSYSVCLCFVDVLDDAEQSGREFAVLSSGDRACRNASGAADILLKLCICFCL